MSIDIAEFIDAEVERSVREERARERRAERRAPVWQEWLRHPLERIGTEDPAPLP
jgi:hypothetical protein